jgi:hypothetical protein
MKRRPQIRCLNCGGSVRQPPRGRPKRYCSASCLQRAYERRDPREALLRDLAQLERARAKRAEAEAAELRRQLAEIRGLPEVERE